MDDPVRGFFDDLKKTALAYSIIMDTGRVVAGLSASGEDVSYDTVTEELSAYGDIGKFMELAKAEGMENTEDWFGQIVEQHAAEVLKEENISVEATRTTGKNAHQGYCISIKDSSLKVVDRVVLRMTAGFLDEEGRECMLELGSFNGEIAPDMMIPGLQNGEEPLAAAYRSAFCVLAAEAPEPEWYELEYSGGSSVIALDQELDGSGTWRIPILLMRSGITE